MKRAWLPAAVGTILLLGVGSAVAGPPTVEWSKDRLSVRAEGVAPEEVLRAIGQRTGAELKGVARATEPLSLQLDAVALEDGLKRVLGEQNFTVRYGAEGRPTVIELLGGPEAAVVPSTPPAAGVPAAVDRPPLPPRLGFPRQFASKRPIALPESLHETAGGKTLTFDEVFDLATLQSEGLTRAVASQVVLSQLERDRRLRRAVLSSVTKLEESTLAAFRGTVEGDRLEELLTFLSAHSREKGLQHKATLALDRFRSATGRAHD